MVGKNQEYATTVTVDDDKDMDSNGGLASMTGGNGMEPAARSANALYKRAEQLKRWQDSETNRENPNPLRGGVAVSWSNSSSNRSKVKFSDECVFLAACAAGDIDEVERLLENGADINTTNVDGMTALHQAVIDQNLDVVQYLVENNADIDAQDNEGWTPLMAGVSCEFKDIVRYLLDKGADPSAVNSDGELPLDLTDSPEMRSILEQEISRRGISLEDARHREEQSMLRDALELLNNRSLTREKEKRHPRTGATALHVAAAKGYIKVLNILLQAGSDVNAVDFEGWTPLHGAAHWGERQACEILVEHMANMDVENHAKQTCFDVADSDELCQALEEMKKKQEQIKKERKPFDTLIEQNALSRQPQEYKIRKNSITRISTDSKKNITKSDETKEAEALRTASSSSEASDNEQDDEKKIDSEVPVFDDSPSVQTPVASPPAAPATPLAAERKRQEAVQPTAGPPKLPKLEAKEKPVTTTGANLALSNTTTTSPSSPLASVSVTVVQPTRPRQVASVASTVSTSPTTLASSVDTSKAAAKLEEAKAPSPVSQSGSKPVHGPPVIVPSEPSTPAWRLTGRRGLHPSIGGASSENGSAAKSPSPQSPTVVSVQVTSTTAPTPSRVTVVGASPSAEGVKWRSSKFEKHMSFDEAEKRHAISEPAASSSTSPFRSFTPPQRTEESEAERKVRAKRERESRRSTQGVTLETVKMAEQMYGDGKKGSTSEDEKTKSKPAAEKATTGDAKENKPPSEGTPVQRPSTIEVESGKQTSASLYPWRTTGRITMSDSGSDTAKSDASTPTEKLSSKSSAAVPLVKRFQNNSRSDQDEAAKDTSVEASVATATVTSTASTSPQSASSVSANIPNRKRLRNTRRSTGPVAQEDVQLALETDQEGQMTADEDNSSMNGKVSTTGGGDQKQPSQATPSKLTVGPTVIPIGTAGGISPVQERKNIFSGGNISEQQTNLSGNRTNNRYPFVKGDVVSSSPSRAATVVNAATANPIETDYKKLYEREKAENDRLLEKIKYLENLIESTRLGGGKQTGSGDPGQPLNERERRTLEKRIAQLEEETKVVEQLRADNQRLKEENGALIRVISKLSK